MRSDLRPCWKCRSPGVIGENGGYTFAVCTNDRGCSNAGEWGVDVSAWNRGGLTEVQELRKHIEYLEALAKCDAERIEELDATVNELYNHIRDLAMSGGSE